MDIGYLTSGRENTSIQPKNIPGQKALGFVPPNMDYTYFRHAETYPFLPHETSFSLINAWWLAECSFLAYAHPGFARMAFAIAGLEGFRFFSQKGTECMIAWNANAVIVSFRGTELRSVSAIREISIDLDTVPVPFPHGGKVHRGFLRALNDIWNGEDGLSEFLIELQHAVPGRALWFTGHSLGGALATLAFAQIQDAKGLYIYGSPRVGDEDFTALMRERPVWRVEHSGDPIVHLPPDVPQIGLEFASVGGLVFIDRSGDIHTKRPQIDPAVMKNRAKKTFRRQVTGFLRILKRLRMRVGKRHIKSLKSRKPIVPKDVMQEIGEYMQKSAEEWRGYLSTVEEQTGLRIDDHMPIFYAVKLWNSIVADEVEESEG